MGIIGTRVYARLRKTLAPVYFKVVLGHDIAGTHSGSPCRRARVPANVAVFSGIAAARSPSASPPLHPNPASVRRRLLAGSHRRPLVVPGHRGVRPSTRPIAYVVRVRQVSRCSPVIVFVLGSASSSPVPAASCLRPRIAAEVVPSPFVSVVPEPSPPPVRRHRSHASSRGASVVLEVSEVWFAVVAEGSECRLL
uniref:Cell wall protein-like n=1 Tax=Oryza sativa subsp. japonica TaxID=39947 RepID=Q69T81_ORYSJ|nr:cell wall protein-like [Oryza sativa Japonica Group]